MQKAIAKLRCRITGHLISEGAVRCARCHRDACEILGHDLHMISKKQRVQVCLRCKAHGWFEGATTALVALVVLAAAALASSPITARAQTPTMPTGNAYAGANPVRGVVAARLFVTADGGATWSPMTQPGAAAAGAVSLSTNYGFTGTAWVPVLVDASGRYIVNVNSLPALPAGANVIGHVIVDTAPSTAITASSLPLPTNAAQETGGNLATISNTVRTPAAIGAPSSAQYVFVVNPAPPLNPFLPRCNKLRTANCQP